MTIREATIAKLQQLPESLLQQVSDFIDHLTGRQVQSTAIDNPDAQLSEAWAQWFEAIDRLEIASTGASQSCKSQFETNFQNRLASKALTNKHSCSLQKWDAPASTELVNDYQQLLLSKYRQQGLEL